MPKAACVSFNFHCGYTWSSILSGVLFTLAVLHGTAWQRSKLSEKATSEHTPHLQKAHLEVEFEKLLITRNFAAFMIIFAWFQRLTVIINFVNWQFSRYMCIWGNTACKLCLMIAQHPPKSTATQTGKRCLRCVLKFYEFWYWALLTGQKNLTVNTALLCAFERKKEKKNDETVLVSSR